MDRTAAILRPRAGQRTRWVSSVLGAHRRPSSLVEGSFVSTQPMDADLAEVVWWGRRPFACERTPRAVSRAARPVSSPIAPPIPRGGISTPAAVRTGVWGSSTRSTSRPSPDCRIGPRGRITLPCPSGCPTRAGSSPPRSLNSTAPGAWPAGCRPSPLGRTGCRAGSSRRCGIRPPTPSDGSGWSNSSGWSAPMYAATTGNRSNGRPTCGPPRSAPSTGASGPGYAGSAPGDRAGRR